MTSQTPDDRSSHTEKPKGTASSDDQEEVPDDVAEKPGSDTVSHKHADELADEWGKESFPGSDPPAHY